MVHQVRNSKMNAIPDDVPIPYEEVQNPCRTSYGYPNAAAAGYLSTLTLLLTLALVALLIN